jgi:hypothetical protein
VEVEQRGCSTFALCDGHGLGGGSCRLRHASALAAGERMQWPRLPGQRAAAESLGAARSGHTAGGAQRKGAHRAAAATSGFGELPA